MERQKKMEEKFSEILSEGCGFDMQDPNLVETPHRLAKMYRNEIFCGCEGEFDGYKVFPNEDNYDQIIMFDNLAFTGWCSHHMLPFPGRAWLLYIPGDWLVGTSKPGRALAHFSARPQLQERLCHQWLDSFVEAVNPSGCMAFMRASHTCTTSRGVRQNIDSGMVTSVVYGKFKDCVEMELKGLQLIDLSLKLRG